jgi:hypothetical protein
MVDFLDKKPCHFLELYYINDRNYVKGSKREIPTKPELSGYT